MVERPTEDQGRCHQEGLCQGIGEVSRRQPRLSRRQALVWVVYRYGKVLTRRGGIRSVAHFIAAMQEKAFTTVR